jgi:hypothetical protein
MKFKINHTILVQLLYLSLAGITAWQKISGLTVPQWFQQKFENSVITFVPYGISISFLLITFLELSIALIMIYSLVKLEYKLQEEKLVFNFGLDLSMILFLLLFFGSFLVGDYDNGALDFLYFIGTLVIRKKIIV